MKSRWLHLLITIFIIFSYMQFEYVRYCMECDAGYQEYSYANAVINIVGDRYLILLVSGILIVWSIAGLLAVTRNNFYLKLRIGSEHRANVIEVVYAFKYAVIIAVIQWVVINMIAVVNSFYNVQSQMLHVTKVYQLFGNLLLFYWLLGCVTILFNKLINTGWAANICSIVCLLINIVISNRISFKDSFIGRKSWIAHLMVTDVKTYSFYIVYWSVSIAFVIMVIFYRAVILNFFKRLIAICVKSYYGLTFMAAVVIWSIYGFVSKQYMSGITDYFAGFKKLDIFLLLYLFYQMPIWILLYYFLTKNFSFYYIQFALRKGNTISWMKHLAIIFLVCTYLYYGVGMIVIAFISGTVINVNLIMEMSNMILQTIALLLLVFLCWLHEAGDKHMGFLIIAFLSVLIQVLLGEGEEKALSASIIIKIIIFSPVLEELFNRCAVITILKTILKADNVVYMLISAVIFAMFHINSLNQSGFMQEISNLLIYFILGMGCAYVYLRTNNILSAIVLHMFWNVSIVGGIISDIAHR